MLSHKEYKEWISFCQQATDQQLLNIIDKEYNGGRVEYAQLAKTIAISRGLL